MACSASSVVLSWGGQRQDSETRWRGVAAGSGLQGGASVLQQPLVAGPVGEERWVGARSMLIGDVEANQWPVFAQKLTNAAVGSNCCLERQDGKRKRGRVRAGQSIRRRARRQPAGRWDARCGVCRGTVLAVLELAALVVPGRSYCTSVTAQSSTKQRRTNRPTRRRRTGQSAGRSWTSSVRVAADETEPAGCSRGPGGVMGAMTGGGQGHGLAVELHDGGNGILWPETQPGLLRRGRDGLSECCC